MKTVKTSSAATTAASGYPSGADYGPRHAEAVLKRPRQDSRQPALLTVEWSDDALADLDRFSDFLRQTYPAIAKRVAQEIIATAGRMT
jgi:hypothetical protein